MTVWNQCEYCGKYFGWKEIDTGRARAMEVPVFDPIGTEPKYEWKSYHIKCKLKSPDSKWTIQKPEFSPDWRLKGVGEILGLTIDF